jgi:hypothetical protein
MKTPDVTRIHLSGIKNLSLFILFVCSTIYLPAQELISFEKNGKYGFKDAANRVVIQPIYQGASYSFTSLGGVSTKDGWAVINNKGQLLTGFVYSGVGDAKGYDLVPVFKARGLMGANHYYGIVSKNGTEVAKPEYSFVEIVSNQLAILSTFDNYGMINASGQMVLPLQFSKETLRIFKNIQPNGAYYQNNQWKAFSFDGANIRKWKYDNIVLDGEYLWPVKYRNKWGYVDTLEREIVSPVYDSVGIYKGGIAWVALAGKKGVMNNQGKLVLPVQYDLIGLFGENGYLVYMNGKCGVVSKNGTELIPVKYNAIQPFAEELAPVKLADKWGFVNQGGKEVIAPLYDGALSFSDGAAAVVVKQKVGFINKDGRMIIEPQFEDVVESFYKGKAIVVKGGKEIYIDKTGKEIK